MSDAGASRPGYFAPTSDTDERPLRGFPANLCHEGDTFSTLLAELSRRNSEALVLSATGRDLDSDLTVSAGHAHSDRDSSLDWMASFSFNFVGDEGDNREAALIIETSAMLQGVMHFAVPINSSGDPLYRTLYWRVRPEVPGAGFTACELTIRLDIYGYNIAGAISLLGSTSLVIARDYASDGQAYLDGSSLFIAPASLLAVAPQGHLVALVFAHVNTQGAALYEIQVGWQ